MTGMSCPGKLPVFSITNKTMTSGMTATSSKTTTSSRTNTSTRTAPSSMAVRLTSNTASSQKPAMSSKTGTLIKPATSKPQKSKGAAGPWQGSDIVVAEKSVLGDDEDVEKLHALSSPIKPAPSRITNLNAVHIEDHNIGSDGDEGKAGGSVFQVRPKPALKAQPRLDENPDILFNATPALKTARTTSNMDVEIFDRTEELAAKTRKRKRVEKMDDNSDDEPKLKVKVDRDDDEDLKGSDPEEFKGLFRSLLILRIFATHLSAIEGAIDVEGLYPEPSPSDDGHKILSPDRPIGALGLAGAAVECGLILWKYLAVTYKGSASTQPARPTVFKACGWSAETKCFAKSATKLSRAKLLKVVKLGSDTLLSTRGPRELIVVSSDNDNGDYLVDHWSSD
ncbi:hypothetical protein BKA93DRAFT_928896 [Sparassis latifolia]